MRTVRGRNGDSTTVRFLPSFAGQQGCPAITRLVSRLGARGDGIRCRPGSRHRAGRPLAGGKGRCL